MTFNMKEPNTLSLLEVQALSLLAKRAGGSARYWYFEGTCNICHKALFIYNGLIHLQQAIIIRLHGREHLKNIKIFL